MSLVLDTHAVIWYLSGSKQLSPVARSHIDKELENGQAIFISAISLVEIVYLCERGRLPLEALQRLMDVLAGPSQSIVAVPIDKSVAETIQIVPRDVVPDMPDRIIGATAIHLNADLVTRDRQLQTALGHRSVW